MARNKAAQEAHRAERAAEEKAEEAAANPAVEAAARLGFVVRAAIFATMGVLALGLMLGRSGPTDPRGSLKLFSGMLGDPWGRLLLVAVAVGLAGFSLWYFLRVFADPLGRSGGGKGWMRRLGFLGRGAAYGALLLFSIQLALGGGGEDEETVVRRVVSAVLEHPLGPWLIAGCGLAAAAAGVVQFSRAVRRSPRQDLAKQEMSKEERAAAENLGRFGAVARGMIFVLLGWFAIQAAVWRDPEQARGVSGALAALAAQPAGRFLLGAVGVGLIALALYCLACARWLRQAA